jgi:hypothetical protein
MIKQNLKVQHIFLFKSRMNMAMIFLWNSLGAVTQYSNSKRKHAFSIDNACAQHHGNQR